MSPSDLEVLIHYHCFPLKHPRCNAPAVIQAIKMFLRDEIIKECENDSGYTTTEKGRAWVKMILSTPYPTQQWVDDKGNVINN